MTDEIASIVEAYQRDMEDARARARDRIRGLFERGKVTEREYAGMLYSVRPREIRRSLSR